MTSATTTAIAYDGATPTVDYHSGSTLGAEGAAGAVRVLLGETRGAPAEGSVLMAALRGVLAPGTLHAASALHIDTRTKHVDTVRRAASASVRAPLAVDMAALSAGHIEQHVYAAGSVAFVQGQPRWLWQSGAWREAIIVNAVGDIQLELAPGSGLAPASSLTMVTPRLVLQAGQMVAMAIEEPSETARRITLVRESGNTSVRANAAFDVMVFGPAALVAPLPVHALGAIRFDAQGAPSWLWQSGDFEPVIEHAGAGELVINLGIGRGVDEASCAVFVSPHGSMGSGELRTVGVSHLSAESKYLTLSQELPAGSSDYADFDVDVAIVTPNGPIPAASLTP